MRLAVDRLAVGVLLVGLGGDARQDDDRAGALAPLPLQLPFLLVAGGFLLGEAAGFAPLVDRLLVDLELLHPVAGVDPLGGGQVGARAVLGDLVLFVEAAAVEDEVGGGGVGVDLGVRVRVRAAIGVDGVLVILGVGSALVVGEVAGGALGAGLGPGLGPGLGAGGVGAAGPLAVAALLHVVLGVEPVNVVVDGLEGAIAEDDAEGGDGLGVGGVLAADGGEAAGGVRGGADETAESGKAEGFHLLDVAGDLLGALALVRGEPLRRGRERWMEEG